MLWLSISFKDNHIIWISTFPRPMCKKLTLKTIVWEVGGYSFLSFILGMPGSEVSGLSVSSTTTVLCCIAIGSNAAGRTDFCLWTKAFQHCEPKWTFPLLKLIISGSHRNENLTNILNTENYSWSEREV